MQKTQKKMKVNCAQSFSDVSFLSGLYRLYSSLSRDATLVSMDFVFRAFLRLGDYARGHFSDRRVHKPLKKFQQAIGYVKKELVDE